MPDPRPLTPRAGALAPLLTTLALAFGFALAQSDVVNVYTARHYATDEALYERFEAETGIEVRIIEGDSDELIARMQSEGDDGPADVFLTVDAGRLWRAEQAGLLQPIDSDVVEAAVPDAFLHPDGLWFGLTQRVRGLVTSVDRVEPGAITTYEELADPEWADRICIRSSSNIYNQSLVASLIESVGAEAAEAWADGVNANMARPPQGGDTDQIRAVAAGECDVAVVNHYYLSRLIASGDAGDQEVADAVRFVYPNQDGRGAHVNVSGGGLVASAPNPENGRALLEFLVSQEAQEAFAASNNEFPILAGAAASDAAAGLGDFTSDAVNVVSYGENNPEAVRIFDRVGWR
mgnify:CR=1 FL=1